MPHVAPPPSGIRDWPALEAAVVRLAQLEAEANAMRAELEAATAAALRGHGATVRRLSDADAIRSGLRASIEGFCRERHDQIVAEGRKSRDLAGGHSVGFALDPPSVRLLPKQKLAEVCKAICRRGRRLLGFLKKPKPDLDRAFILKQYREAEDPKAINQTLAALGLEVHQEERFELKLGSQ